MVCIRSIIFSRSLYHPVKIHLSFLQVFNTVLVLVAPQIFHYVAFTVALKLIPKASTNSLNTLYSMLVVVTWVGYVVFHHTSSLLKCLSDTFTITAQSL